MWLAKTGGAAGADGWTSVDESGITSIYSFSAHDFAWCVVAARPVILRLPKPISSGCARADAARKHVTGVAASRYDTVTAEEIRQGGILATVLEGTILFAQGERATGLARVREAITTADTMAFEYGPPFSAKPLDELLGDLLLTAGKPVEAVSAYEMTLAAHLNRRLSVEGLAAARAAQ